MSVHTADRRSRLKPHAGSDWAPHAHLRLFCAAGGVAKCNQAAVKSRAHDAADNRRHESCAAHDVAPPLAASALVPLHPGALHCAAGKPGPKLPLQWCL